MLQNGTPQYAQMRLQEIAAELDQIIELYEGLYQWWPRTLEFAVDELRYARPSIRRASELLDELDLSDLQKEDV